jgi:GNAT superfamily N-acetyltransferase
VATQPTLTEDPPAFVADLARRLATAVTGAELQAATRPPDGSGVSRSAQTDRLRIDLRVVPSVTPRVALVLDPPVDARRLCAAWGIERPVAVSTDVHQQSWRILVGGPELPDPHGRRIVADDPRVGRWEVGLRLTGRPPGGLPDVSAGASPAYDVVERGGAVRLVEIAAFHPPTTEVDGSQHDARAILGRMADAYPHWRSGWEVPPGTPFVLLSSGGRSAAGAAITASRGGIAQAAKLCVVSDQLGTGFGPALLEVLEALARDAGARELRLDASAFLQAGAELPIVRYGYVIAPPYAGDADVPVWPYKDLEAADPAAWRADPAVS